MVSFEAYIMFVFNKNNNINFIQEETFWCDIQTEYQQYMFLGSEINLI